MNFFVVALVVVFAVGLVGVAVFVVALCIALLRSVGSVGRSGGTHGPGTRNSGDAIDGMNEGDLHGGPFGYSPGTAYPETQYGSGFNPEAEWNHDDRD